MAKQDGEQVSVILPRKAKRAARVLAQREGITLAAWVRRLVLRATDPQASAQ
jgi:hypothetical protein